MKRLVLLTAVLGTWASEASAITIDGTRDAGYGAPIAVQDTPTQFGNNENELNAAYGFIDDFGNLRLMLTGNLKNSGDGLVIFIDSRAGGAVEEPVEGEFGTIGSVGGARTDDWGTDTDGSINNNNPTPGGGSILDPGFNPDISIEINACCGSTYYTNIIDMTLPNEPAPERDIYLGSNDFGMPAVTQTYDRSAVVDGIPGDADPTKGHGGTIQHAFNNSNTAGVNGFDNADPPGALGDPLSATTGYEAMFSAAFLANDGQPIRIMAFITNGGGDFLSNQFLGENGVNGSGNLAGAFTGSPLFDAELYPGNQFFVVPVGVPVIEGISGDYNDDDVVDAADYVVWRHAGASDTLPNDDTPGTVDSTDYDVWVANFGRTPSGSGALDNSSAAVPEPASAVLLLMAAVFAIGLARR